MDVSVEESGPVGVEELGPTSADEDVVQAEELKHVPAPVLPTKAEVDSRRPLLAWLVESSPALPQG